MTELGFGRAIAGHKRGGLETGGSCPSQSWRITERKLPFTIMAAGAGPSFLGREKRGWPRKTGDHVTGKMAVFPW